MKVNKKSVIRWKIYLDRARNYLQYINFFMLIFVALEAAKDYSVGKILSDNPIISVPVMAVILLAVSLVLGYLDTHLGIRKEEMRNHAEQNPVTMDILNTVRSIKKELEEQKNKAA